MRDAILVVAIFLGICFSTINVMRAAKGQCVPFWNFIIMSAALTAVITYYLKIW